jgi:hypothetical protein
MDAWVDRQKVGFSVRIVRELSLKVVVSNDVAHRRIRQM